MSNFNFNELINGTVRNFAGLNENEDTLFEMGNDLEILSEKGKENILKSLIFTLKSDLEREKEAARKLLIERDTIAAIQKSMSLSNTTFGYLDERYNSIQEKYQNQFSKVSQIEKALSFFE